MRDDFSPPDWNDEPFAVEDEWDRRRSRVRGCIYTIITIILIFSLAGGSVLIYLFATRDRSAPTPVAPSFEAIVTPPPPAVERSLPTVVPSPMAASAAPDQAAAPIQGLEAALAVNRIALINRSGQVETIAPDGSDARILTSPPERRIYQFPAWSPAGTHLAVIGANPLGGGIFLLDDSVDSDSREPSPLYFSQNRIPFYLYWSPDGSRLAFLANHARNTIGLNVVEGDGRSESRLLATGSPFYWNWAQDSRQLLVHIGQAGAEELLGFIDADGNASADGFANPGLFQAPGISHDSRYLAYAEDSGGATSALTVLDTASGERTAYQEAGSLALSWSPTEPKIAYVEGEVEGHPFWGPLHLLDVSTGESRVIAGQTVLAFFWSPDGRSIAYFTLNQDRGDEEINVSVPSLQRVGLGTAPPPQPVQQRGLLSLVVVDVATGRGMRLLDFEPTGVFITQFLPYYDQYALSHRIWSPDSQAIVLPIREDSGGTIVVVPTAGARPYRLAEGEIAFWSYR